MSERPAPLLQAARLFAKTSARGSDYLTGRWGGVRVLVLVNKNFIEGDAENGHSHVLMLAEAAPYQANPVHNPVLPFPPKQNIPPASWDDQPRPPARYARKAAGGGRSQISEDPVPF